VKYLLIQFSLNTVWILNCWESKILSWLICSFSTLILQWQWQMTTDDWWPESPTAVKCLRLCLPDLICVCIYKHIEAIFCWELCLTTREPLTCRYAADFLRPTLIFLCAHISSS
jgi:hypothetical protein